MTVTAPPPTSVKLPRDGAAAGFLRLESVNAAQNRFRFYTFTWQQTLWGEWAICCTWGRIGGLGRSRVAYLGHHNGVPDALVDLVAHRIRRGYQLRRGQPERASGNGSSQAGRGSDSRA